jgi:tRNA/tmRNA/rRNA uracil-C5-methylase (TrmA/RlmC/RlmD family)
MQTINITIQKPAYGGYGLGFCDNGKACFVQYALPGEEISAEIISEKKDYCFGRIISINKKSEHRIEPVCPNFGLCGGCDYLNIDYGTELRYKKEILLETLKRSRIDERDIPEIEIIKADRFHYRSHASVKSTKNAFGFYGKNSYQLAAFPEAGCKLLAEDLLHILDTLPGTGSEIKIACSAQTGCISSLDKSTTIIENEAGICYGRDIRLFFQQNRFLRAKMIGEVIQYAGPDKSKSFLDIGCGVGFFTLHLAKTSKKALGIDISKESIKWGKHNAKINRITNAIFKTLPASEIRSLKERFDAVVADPPRAGLPAKAREAVKALAPGLIVYVSCDPATFARDNRDFIESGYKLERLTIIDMFPATLHIEVIGLLKLPIHI